MIQLFAELPRTTNDQKNVYKKNTEEYTSLKTETELEEAVKSYKSQQETTSKSDVSIFSASTRNVILSILLCYFTFYTMFPNLRVTQTSSLSRSADITNTSEAEKTSSNATIAPIINWKEIVSRELENFDNSHHHCGWNLVINQTHIYKKGNMVGDFWHKFMKQLLQEYTIPDVRFHILHGDYGYGQSACLAASTSSGLFNVRPSPAITNWQVIQQIAGGWLRADHNLRSWEDRNATIVWRGSIGGGLPPEGWLNMTDDEIMDRLAKREPRLKAVNIARNSSMLDVAISGPKPRMRKFIFWKPGRKGRSLYPFSKIPSNDYYGNYRGHLVLCGIGAAFRTTKHLQQRNLILLQKCKYEEWFVKYMDPWKHYLPLKFGLENLLQLVDWIRDNEEKAKEIAIAGNQFFLTYLEAGQTMRFIAQYLTSIAEMNVTWIDDAEGNNAGPPAKYSQNRNYHSIVRATTI